MTSRRAGLCVHVSSLPGGYGIGNFGAAARALIDWMAEAGFSVWQFLPLGPTGHGNSPYQLLSAFAGNPLYIDPDALIADGLLERREVLPGGPEESAVVDFGAVIDHQSAWLATAASRFSTAAHSTMYREYEAFCLRHDDTWLSDYVLYATLKRAHGGRPWIDWPRQYRNRNDPALTQWRDSRAAELDAERFVQFIWFRQWQRLAAYARERGVLLFGDVPIYLPHDCADTWAERSLLDLDERGRPVEVAGVPPDYFSADGQRWGNPLYAWDRHAADGYRWWIARLRHAFSGADMVRLDHFRGFEAYWAIPADKPAREGYWRPGPGADFFRAVREALGDCEIIAEDLGIITEDVTALRRAFGMPGMQVLQFLVGEESFDPCAIEEDCVCYTGTHDNDTVVGWFHQSARPDPESLHQLQETVCARLGCGGDRIGYAMIGLNFRTRAQLAVIPVQDVLGLGAGARMNTPGTVGDNWAWRLTPGQLDEHAATQMRAMIQAAGRVVAQDARDSSP